MIKGSNPEVEVTSFFFQNSAEFTDCVPSACGYRTVSVHLSSDSLKGVFVPLLSMAAVW